MTVFGKPHEDILAKSVTVKDILTLKDNDLLNDSVINHYLEMIKERAEGDKKRYRSVYSFSSHLYPTLKDKGYSGVWRWTRKVDLFSFSLVLVPVHLPGGAGHWCLAVIDMEAKTIQYYDSIFRCS